MGQWTTGPLYALVRAALLEGTTQIVQEQKGEGPEYVGLTFIIREAIVEMLDSMVCDPVLPSKAAGYLLGLSGPTVSRYRRIIAAKLAI